MRHLRHVCAVLCLLLVAACTAAPDGSSTQERIDNPDPNINSSGMPIVKEKVTITFLTSQSASTAEDWNEVAAMKRMEELSNVHIDFGLVPAAGAKEKRNLALASGDYPEVIYRTGLTNDELAKYGEQGTFVPLNTLIEQHMPHLKKILEDHPDIAKGLTFPDGNIYGLPTIYDPEFTSLAMQNKLWVRQDWLDKFGMSVPTTIEEYEAYLQAVKTQDPNGNGKADEIPLADANKGENLSQMLWGTFGVGNRGNTSRNFDADPESGAARFFPASDGYRDLMEFLNHLYAEGLIQTDIFTNDLAKFSTLGKGDVYGSVAISSPGAFLGEVGENYVALPPLKQNASDPVPSWNAIGPGLRAMGGFVITDKAEHPVEAARWMDHWYGEEGARLFFLGIEGESYAQTSPGVFEFLPQIANNSQGLSVDEALKPYVNYMGGGYPGIVKEANFKGTESSPQAREGTEAVAPHAAAEVWPAFTYTPAEAKELSALMSDIDKYATESRANFIAGKTSLDEWDAYLARLDQMGLKRYVEIVKGAQERFSA